MSLGMFVLIIVLLVIFVACYVAHRKRLAKEFEEKVQSFVEICDSFFAEFDGLFKHYVQDDERDAFVFKYKALYQELQRYSGIPSKVEDFVKLEDFKKKYKDFPRLVFASNAEIKRKERLKLLLPYVNTFLDELSFLTSRYVTYADGEIFYQKWKKLSQNVASCNLKTNDEGYEKINLFEIIYKDFSNYLEKANKSFIEQESQKYDCLLSNIDGKSLDMQQREAVITDEDRILVLAGAGSGKTLTIAGKVKYLCDAKNISPEEILLISFTKKSAQEMTDRIQGKLGIPVKSTTFHKLGLDIIKSAVGKRPDILDESLFNEFIHNFFEKELVNYPELVKNLIEYFAYYIDIPQKMENYSSLGEMYEAEKSVDLETLRSKYDQEKYIQEEKIKKSLNHTTLKNEKVKSLEEVQIANFLFLNGVNYEYEKLYPFENPDPLRKTYRPDFYLKDYDIYLEHFGITRNNTVPWLSPIEAQKYLDGIDWKRELHRQNNTKLIETYSYYNSEGVLLQKLEDILKQNGVVLKSRDFMDIFNTVYSTKTNKYFSEFVKLCGTFIVLFKSNNYTIETIDNWKDWLSSEDNNFLQRRNTAYFVYKKISSRNDR